MSFRVLVVCTGNICRSPIAEHLLRAAGVTVSSAGARALAGQPMSGPALDVLAARGIDGSAFRARQLTAELVADADLVLGASREHRAAAVTLVPRAAVRTFTIREFDRLLSGVDAADLPTEQVERAAALVRGAAGQRGLIRPTRPEDDDVADPYGGPAAGYPPCADLIEASLQRWLTLLAG